MWLYTLSKLYSKQKIKPTAKEKAHLQSATPATKPKIAKELFPSLFSPPPKKNKFPSPTPAYLQFKRKTSTAYNSVLAKCGVKIKVEIFLAFIRRLLFRIDYFCNLTIRKKHRLRLGILELKFFEFPALRQYFFVTCNSPTRKRSCF